MCLLCSGHWIRIVSIDKVSREKGDEALTSMTNSPSTEHLFCVRLCAEVLNMQFLIDCHASLDGRLAEEEL